MSNRYGITLDPAWTEWAAKQEVSETVAAAVLLICETRPLQEVVAKLTPGEFERVVDIVRRAPDHFPSGTLAALKSRSPIHAGRPSSDSLPTDQAPRQSSKPESGKERGSIGNLFGIVLDQASLRWAAAEGVSETVIAAVLLLHERSVEEIAGKLTPAELGDVTRLVSRCPSCYPPGAYAALKAKRDLVSPTTRSGVAAHQLIRRHTRAHTRFSPHAARASRPQRPDRAGLSQNDGKHSNAAKSSHHRQRKRTTNFLASVAERPVALPP